MHDPNKNEKTHPQLFIIEDHADDCEQSLPQVRRPDCLIRKTHNEQVTRR